MRKAIVLIVISTLVFLLGSLACNNSNTIGGDDFNGTDTMVREMRIGSTMIQNGGKYQLAFQNITTMDFNLNSPIDVTSFEQFLDIKIILHNLDTDSFFVLTKPSMLENGHFVISNDGYSVQYRMNHTMERLWVGGTPQEYVSPGDTIQVTVDYVSGRDANGNWFAFRFDEFDLAYVTMPQ